MPSRPPPTNEPHEPMRPPMSPSLAYETFNSETSPPTISAFVAEAVVYLSNATVTDTTSPPTDGAQSADRDTAPVINAVVRLLDTMTATRFSRIQNLIAEADQELSNSSVGTDDLGDSLLDDFDLAFQCRDPEVDDSATKAILSDGSVVTIKRIIPQGGSAETASDTSLISGGLRRDSVTDASQSSRDESFWKKLLNFGFSRESSGEHYHSGITSSQIKFFDRALKQFDCSSVPLRNVTADVGTGPLDIKNDQITSVQGYTWSSLEDYNTDKAQRIKHFRQKLMGTRQFLERKSGRILRQVATGASSTDLQALNSDLDVRRQKRKTWLKLRSSPPQPQLLAKLRFFHRQAKPVYDHFQLKNLLCLRSDKEVFYLGHEQHGDRYHTCVMSYNLQTHESRRSLGPWSFNCARPLSHTARPIYHSLASISFESRYLFALAVSENYVATSDTSSSILLSKRQRQKSEKDGSVATNEPFNIRGQPVLNPLSPPTELPIAGHRILCQRVSSQPLQIINSIQLIEVSRQSRNHDCWSQETSLLSLIRKQAEEKSQRVFCAACHSLEHMCEEVKLRVALGQAWQKLKRDQNPDSRTLRRLRTLFTPTTSAFMRNSISVFTPEENNSRESSPEQFEDHLPSPSKLIVLTAGNDKTLCEYSLDAQLCRDTTHISLNNGDSICRLRSSGVNGFSACVKVHNARYKNVLRLTRSWPFPFCINRIAVHPDQNILLLVGDNPSVMITARSAPSHYYLGRHGSIKNSIYTIDYHQDASFAAAWHPNGIMFATGSDDRTVAIWDLRQLLAPLRVLRTEVTACRNLEFSPDGRFLLSCESEDAVVLYSVIDDFAIAQKIPFFGGCTGAAFSSDSERIILGIGPPGGLMELVISRLPAAAACRNQDLLVS